MVCPLYSILHSPIQLSIQQFQPFIQHSTLIFKTFNYSLDCLQSTFSLKIRLDLDLIPRDCKPRCYYIGIETRREKTDCWLFCSKQTLRQPRNGVTDWSIAQLLTDHWLVCGEIASNKNSHASQTTANNSEPSSNLSNKTFKDILQKETAVNFLKGNEFKAILPDLKKV